MADPPQALVPEPELTAIVASVRARPLATVRDQIADLMLTRERTVADDEQRQRLRTARRQLRRRLAAVSPGPDSGAEVAALVEAWAERMRADGIAPVAHPPADGPR